MVLFLVFWYSGLSSARQTGIGMIPPSLPFLYLGIKPVLMTQEHLPEPECWNNPFP